MSTNLLKSGLAAVIVAVIAVTAAPVVANAAMANMASHCDSTPSPQKAAVPNCCLVSDCPMFSLSNAVDKKAILFSSPASNNTPIALNPTEGSESTSACTKPPPHDPAGEFPSPSNITYQCRNCLNSDDPLSL